MNAVRHTGWRRWAARLLGAGCCVAASLAHGQPDSAALLAAELQMEVLLQQGEDFPEEALSALPADQAAPEGVQAAAWQRMLLRTRGLVAARSGMTAVAKASVEGLQALNAAASSPQLQGDQALIQASLHELLGQAELAEQQARLANARYAQACGARVPAQDCNPRAWWRVLRLLALRAEGQGALVDAMDWAQRGQAQAAKADDPLMQSASLSGMAVLSHALGDAERASRLMAQADRLARRRADNLALVRVRYNESRLALRQGDDRAGLRLMQEALKLAQVQGSPRSQAQVQAALGDLLRRAGRAREALAAVEKAYPVLKRHRELRAQPQLLHNGGLARLVLGQVSQGRADMEAALAMWEGAGAKAAMELAMAETSEALAGVGDVKGALEFYHREQALREELNSANREAARAQFQASHRTEAQQRELDLLTRENALRSARLQTQAIQERVWLLAALLLVLGAGLAAVLIKRARDANHQLRHNEVLLKVQSERDPLTGLANRRHFRDVLVHLGADQGFRGGLMLLDLDHFKRVNDDHGHQAGDVVLVEVAQRLGASLRADDLACRWGGEEFLVLAPGMQGDDLAALAQRMLHAVGDVPFAIDSTRELSVTTSIGYASFPLPEHQVALNWEHAVNLVDMALYTAKSMGRDRAVGLLSAQASDAAALMGIERDFELARLAGDVSLRVEARS